MDTTTDPTAALKLAREALLSLLADSPRPYDEMLGRQALAALDALPAPAVAAPVQPLTDAEVRDLWAANDVGAQLTPDEFASLFRIAEGAHGITAAPTKE